MDITGSVALVTGANRGLGRQFAAELVERGAARVYATARDPRSISVAGVEVLALDLLDPHSVDAAAAVARLRIARENLGRKIAGEARSG